MTNLNDELKEEAEAFNKRISERLQAGFVPDLRNAVKTEFFYKSFWRDPYFINLYLGEQVKNFTRILDENCGKNLRILDIGCGAGYMSLELARNGHHVTAFDISEKSIKIANEVLDNSEKDENFGSLQYSVSSFEDYDIKRGNFDVIHFSVALHHLTNVNLVVKKCFDSIDEGKHIFVHEPCHERFDERDAAQVVLIRSILSLLGFWYEKDLYERIYNDDSLLLQEIKDTKMEYLMERDKSEPDGQSPNDLEASGEEMLEALRERFHEIHYSKSTSFIYRVLGGMRGEDDKIHKIADLLSNYDKLAVREGFINENFFYFLGRK